MRRVAWVILPLALAAACEQKPQPPPRAPARPPPAPAFTVRDLALATALDARLVGLSLAAEDVVAIERHAKRGAARDERARRRLPALAVAKAEVQDAAAAVSNPADRAIASRVAALAGRYADGLAAAVASAVPAPVEILRLQGELGGAIELYRRSRAAWLLEEPEPAGPEREFADARRELERAESRLPPARERAARRGADEDPSAARTSGRRAAGRAKAAADALPPTLRGPAVRYAAAQERALAGVNELAAAHDDAESARAGRAYLAAKAEALGALADYFAALAAR